jgi:Plasmid pRiA4b ORF-3-like protein
MSKQAMTGTCGLCGGTFSRIAMTNHLKRCEAPDPKSPKVAGLHLFVESRYNKSYWLHIAVPTESSLSKLDRFLRDIWLECCGHLSSFEIAGTRYRSEGMKEFGGAGMGVKLSRILRPGMIFTYEYDYGSTTELRLKVMGLRDAGNAIEVLARNDAPQIVCQACGVAPATEICTACETEDSGWFCEICAESHECGTDMCLPVVNSPRTGVCGYTG